MSRSLFGNFLSLILSYSNICVKSSVSCGDSNLMLNETILPYILFQRPALSFRVLQSYYENNLSDQEGFTLNNGYYEKTIEESELQLSFDEENDRE